jgi:phosphoglycolate phosphatase
MNILLFDIDGTLIRSGGAGKVAFEAALRVEFGVTEIQDRVNFSGRTDLAIGTDLLRLHDLDATSENLHRLIQGYLKQLPETLNRVRGIVLPGVHDLLKQLAACDRVLMGLLTGNIREGAERKLRHYQLWDYFPFGGFADGYHDRDDIAHHALRESDRHLGKPVDRDCVWVIGDTPLDVKCARAIGAKAVTVTTGWHSKRELIEAGADYIFRDLTEANDLISEWVSPQKGK